VVLTLDLLCVSLPPLLQVPNKGGKGGEVTWISGPRECVVRNVSIPYGFTPCIDLAKLFESGRLPDASGWIRGGFDPYTKINARVELDPLMHATECLVGVQLNEKFLDDFFRERDKMFGDKVLAPMRKSSAPKEVLRGSYKNTMFYDSEPREDGTRSRPYMRPKGIGWGTEIAGIRIKEMKDAEGKPKGNVIEAAEYTPRQYDLDAAHKPRAKGSLVFKYRFVDPETQEIMTTDFWVWREDGSLNNEASPPKVDSNGNVLYRHIGPQDVARGSTADVRLDMTGFNIGDGISAKLMIREIIFTLPEETEQASMDPDAVAPTADAVLRLARARVSVPVQDAALGSITANPAAAAAAASTTAALPSPPSTQTFGASDTWLPAPSTSAAIWDSANSLSAGPSAAAAGPTPGLGMPAAADLDAAEAEALASAVADTGAILSAGESSTTSGSAGLAGTKRGRDEETEAAGVLGTANTTSSRKRSTKL
jgi:hypothetical protein